MGASGSIVRSRRAVLAAGAGSVAALAADALLHPGPGRAGTGDPLVLGEDNSSPGFTTLTCTTPGAQALTVFTSGGGVSVRGEAESGTAVFGQAASGVGVWGGSGGAGGGAYGVIGGADHGVGVYGSSGSGVAVQGECYGGGLAIEALGPCRFETAYLVTVPAGARSVTFEPRLGPDAFPFPMSPATKVLCTPMSDPGPRRVRWVRIDPGGTTFTVFLDAVTPRPITLACFVVG
jgi:hypothetical protein